MTTFIISILGVSLVTSVLALLLSLLLTALKGKISPKVKYFLWLGILFSLLLPFRPRFGQGLVQVERQQMEAPLADTALITETSSQLADQQGFFQNLLNLPWLQILVAIWLVGSLFVLGLQLYRFWQFNRLLKRWSHPITDEKILNSLEGTKELLAIVAPIKISTYELTTTPMLTGFRQPHILLPAQNYTDEELDLVIEHELTHYKHRDIYANLLIMLVTSLYWFNPLVHFMVRETKESAETYCDHDVLRHQTKAYRTFYGETIISMISRGRERQKTVGLSNCFYSNKFKLKRRIEAIVNTDFSNKGLTALAILLVTTSVVFSGSVFALVEQTPRIQTAVLPSHLNDSDIKAKISVLLGISEDDLKDFTLTEKGQSYEISFQHEGKDYLYSLSKTTAKLSLVSSTTSKTSSSSSSTATSSTEKASTASSSAASSPAGQEITTNQTTVTESANTDSQETTNQTVIQSSSQETVQTPAQATTTTTTITPSQPTQTFTPPVTTTPVYSYDDDDWDDDDWADDWDDDDD